MNLSDLCAICHVSMLRNAVLKLSPCGHHLHQRCSTPIINQEPPLCPYCRTEIAESTTVVRKSYRTSTSRDRQLLVECANRGEDWATLAQTLNVKYHTAYTWIRSGETSGQRRGGLKPRILNDSTMQRVLRWIESSASITLKDIKEKLRAEQHVIASVTTIGNRLNGQLYTIKRLHYEPTTMNSQENKLRRKQYVTSLNEHIRSGKQVVWIDETNFNLFIRRNFGRSRQGTRAVVTLPAARGPNIHVIGAISATGPVKFETRRGSFTWQAANEWIGRLVSDWISEG